MTVRSRDVSVRALIFFGALITTACSDTPNLPSAPPVLSAGLAISNYPPEWRRESDSRIWQEIVRTDSSVVVGLKAPGTDRGVVKGRVQMNQASWRAGTTALLAEAGIRVRRVDSTVLPLVELHLGSLADLTRIRRLPFVDYLEPRVLPVISMDGSGCDQEAYSGPLAGLNLPGGGGDYVHPGYEDMNIFNAWNMSAGEGIKVGITDTGLDYSYSGSEFGPTYFASGMSTGRTISNLSNPSYPTPLTCSHGTRLGALIAAPRNGRSIVGVAYRASIVSFNHGEDVTVGNTTGSAAMAIRAVIDSGAKVVSLGWGMFHWSDAVSNEIDRGFYVFDVAFVGAAGTCGPVCQDQPVFPAAKGEVLAASGAEYPYGQRPDNVFDFGDKPGVLAYSFLPTTAFEAPNLASVSGSSAATGIATGVMALVRARNPTMSAQQVYDRMFATTGCKFHWTWKVLSSGLINASAAMGGPCVGYLEPPDMLGAYWINRPGFPDGWEHTLAVPIYSARHEYPGYTYPTTSGYRVEWEFGRGAIVNPSDFSVSFSSNGDAGWAASRRASFLPPPEGVSAYTVEVTARVIHDGLGSVDVRRYTLSVCVWGQPCTPTGPYPGPYVPNPTAHIVGPELIEPGASCTWSATSYDIPEPVQFEWSVNGDVVGTGSVLNYSRGSSFDLHLNAHNAGYASGEEIHVVVQGGAGECWVERKVGRGTRRTESVKPIPRRPLRKP